MQQKPTPMQLRERHGLGISRLAEAAGVPSSAVYDMYMAQPVTRQEAICVLSTISTLTGVTYTLATVEVKLSEDQSDEQG